MEDTCKAAQAFAQAQQTFTCFSNTIYRDEKKNDGYVLVL